MDITGINLNENLVMYIIATILFQCCFYFSSFNNIQHLKKYYIDFKVTIKPEIAPSLQHIVVEEKVVDPEIPGSDEVSIGTTCKNGGCSKTYEGPETNETTCRFHPGVPIFHEGLKFWSCCQKKTTDFNTFLSQVGCQEGTHTWKKDVSIFFCSVTNHIFCFHIGVSMYSVLILAITFLSDKLVV